MKTRLDELSELYSKKENCLMFLYGLHKELLNCVDCNKAEFYHSKEYVRVCSICKKKYSPTYNTVFHNVRFGIVCAFQIYIYITYSRTKVTSVEVSKKYGITQKTAWSFMKKLESFEMSLPESYSEVKDKYKFLKYLNGK